MAKQTKEIEASKNLGALGKTPQKSVKGFYHYIKQAWKKPTEEHINEVRKKMIGWRASERITQIDKPTRLDRARVLGYKAKQGVHVFRVTLERGGRARARPRSQRRSKRMGVMKILRMNYQWVAEQRVQRKHPNLEVLSSYLIGKDGQHAFFEVIALDPHAPEIKSDKTLNWICKPENRNRALRGLTSAGRKSRGLRVHSRRLKVRPSLRAWNRQGR